MSAEGKQVRKILVVDDDPSLLKLMSTILETRGYQVITADEAAVGLEIAMKGRPDLIILDVMMPVINGFNICRLLKTQEPQKKIPVVLLTSRVSDEDRRIGVDVGADAYFCKPLDTETFLVKVRQLLGD